MELIHNHRTVQSKKGEDFYRNEAKKIGLSEGSRQYEEYFKEEALATCIGNRGTQFITEAKKPITKEWTKNLEAKIAAEPGMCGFKIEDIDTITLEEITRRLAADILQGGKSQFFKNKEVQSTSNLSDKIGDFWKRLVAKLKGKEHQKKQLFEDLHEQIFSGGDEEKRHIGKLIQTICEDKLSFNQAIKLYVSSKSRFNVYKNIDGHYMVATIINDSNNKIGQDEAKEVFKLIFFGEKYKYKSSELEDLINVLYGFINNGEVGERLYYSEGLFGLVPSNPIPLKGLLSEEAYLEKLRTKSGEKITWKRMGNFNYEKFSYPLDVYELFDEKGIHIENVFLYPYHGKSIMEAAEGFILSE
jgi:hypothetical protein